MPLSTTRRTAALSEEVTDTPDGLRVQTVLAETIAEMIAHRDYPCLGARSVLRRDRATARGYDRLADPATALRPGRRAVPPADRGSHESTAGEAGSPFCASPVCRAGVWVRAVVGMTYP